MFAITFDGVPPISSPVIQYKWSVREMVWRLLCEISNMDRLIIFISNHKLKHWKIITSESRRFRTIRKGLQTRADARRMFRNNYTA